MLVGVTSCSAPEPATPAAPAVAAAPDTRSLRRCLGELKPSSSPPKPPEDPAASPGTCRVPVEVIQGVVRARFDRYRRCYETVLGADRDARGRVLMRFQFHPDGDVGALCAEVEGPLASEGFLDCMNDAFVTLRFPPVECGGMTTVNYPIVFSPR